MKNPRIKISVAAIVIAAVVLGLFEFGDNGVVWAEVVRKIEASRGVIFRIRGTSSATLEGENGPDYLLQYMAPDKGRTDAFKNGKIVHTTYRDFEARVGGAIFHTTKMFIREDLPENKGLKNHQDQMDPKHLLDKILAVKHTELGKKTVDGVLCEGLETTDPAFMAELAGHVDRLEVLMRIWVDVESKYPVRLERKITAEAGAETMSSAHVVDQFQWDVEIDPAFFQPEIPPDYEQM